MATADLIKELNDDLNAAYSTVEAKGGTVPTEKNSNNLAAAIESISGGSDPYDVPYFDGGEHDTFAYISGDGTIKYYAFKSASDPIISRVNTAENHARLELPDEVISKDNIIAYSFGSQRTTLPTYCLMYCTSLRRLYGLREVCERGNLRAIPLNFLGCCFSFSQPLDIPDTVTELGDSFLTSCYAFNSPLPFLKNITSIGSGFLSSCYSFNRPIELSPQVTTLNKQFMYNCYSFNQSIDVSHITKFDNYFMAGCYMFNQPITLSDQVTAIPNYFLYQATSFNQPLTIPQSVATIGNSFMQTVTRFNSALTLPAGLQSIGSSFLSAANAFAQPLTLPDTLTSIGGNFMYGCENFTGPLNVGKSYGFTSDNYTLCATMVGSPMYVTGISITGENADGWMAGLPNRDTSPYRKLVPYVPQPVAPDLSQPLDQAQLDNLQLIVEQGRQEEFLNLGDELIVNYNGSSTVAYQIVGFEDVEVEGGNTVPAINLLEKTTHGVMSMWDMTGAGKYSVSTVRSSITNTFQGRLDPNFVACLAKTKVDTYGRSGGATDTVYDKLFLPSMAQLGVTDTNYTTANQTRIEGPAFAYLDGAGAEKRARDNNHWTRTSYPNDSYSYGALYYTGDPLAVFYSSPYSEITACNFVATKS